ncbi:MAG: molybdopterin converting factor subunit 1 [Anaerolineae bacterium]|nr:molybdopterin converting factor subunit 1 [Anaerolineae bacterium]MDW8098177.1 molybdopterin converting factor subunit 1 [Anaerolineae bacterium]
MTAEANEIQVTVRFFASLREAIGQGSLTWKLKPDATLADLVHTLDQMYPNAHLTRRSLHMAINHQYASTETPLHDGDEVAIFPPVSGGSEAATVDVYELTWEPLSVDALIRRIRLPACGAVATFVGVVRDHTGDRQVDHLEYEAYLGMAEAMMAQIGAEIRERWPSIRAIGIQHRLGRLEIGEASVVIAISASHRPEVFDACRYAIERLKAIVPIWKKEVWVDGEEWIEGPRWMEEGRPAMAHEPQAAAFS